MGEWMEMDNDFCPVNFACLIFKKICICKWLFIYFTHTIFFYFRPDMESVDVSDSLSATPVGLTIDCT